MRFNVNGSFDLKKKLALTKPFIELIFFVQKMGSISIESHMHTVTKQDGMYFSDEMCLINGCILISNLMITLVPDKNIILLFLQQI